MLQEGIDPALEVIFVGTLPVDVPPESHEVRHSINQFFLAHKLDYIVPVRSCAVEWQWIPDLCAEPRHSEFLDNISKVSRIIIGL